MTNEGPRGTNQDPAIRIRVIWDGSGPAGPIKTPGWIGPRGTYQIVMSIGNKKFGIPGKYQYQIGIWYSCPKFLGIFLVFYRYLEYDLYAIWLNIGIF